MKTKFDRDKYIHFKSLIIEGSKYELYISPHAYRQAKKRKRLLNLLPDMILEAGDKIFDVEIDEEFIISSEVYITTIVVAFKTYRDIAIVTVMDKGHDFVPNDEGGTQIFI